MAEKFRLFFSVFHPPGAVISRLWSTFTSMIFVTGGTGLVGIHLLLDLTRQGKAVRALKRPTSDLSVVQRVFNYYQHPDLFEKIEWVDGDVLEMPGLMEAMEGCDWVYHSAAWVSYQPGDRQKMLQINIEGTANMVNAALELGVKKFCHVSSVAAMGKPVDGSVITEETPWKLSQAPTQYSISKHYSEREVWRAAEEGLNVVIVNPCLILGPGEWERSSGTVFKAVWEGLKFWTSGVNAFVDARDVSKAMIALMESDISSERYLLIGNNLPYRDFFNMVADELDRPRPKWKATPFMTKIAWRAERLKQFLTGKVPVITRESVRSAFHKSEFSNEKVKRDLGFEFIPVEQSVKDTSRAFLMDMKAGKS